MGLLTLLAKRFIAGLTVHDAMRAVERLNRNGILATIDHLGENVHSREEATAAADEYIRILDEIDKTGVQSNVSVKLTMMGLEIDSYFCAENVARIVKKAKELNNFVRIDMEGSAVTQVTLDVFERLHAEFDNVGIVIQSYLYRSEADVRRLNDDKINIRLCKGAYKEPREIAYPQKEAVNESYLKLARLILTEGGHVGLATHDDKMIEPLMAFIKERNIPTSSYEWQMLYGIRRARQEQLAAAGETVRVYVPYGSDWVGYFSRRMMERKENFFFAFRHFFKG